MKQTFPELFEAIKNNRKYSPYIMSMDSEKYFKEFESEFNEVKEAFEKKDYENLQEELGDALWDLIAFSLILEEEGKVNTKKIIKGVLDKMKERKPHIFEKRTPTLEEEREQFFKAKQEQKKRNNSKPPKQ